MGPDQNLVSKREPIRTVRQNWQLTFTLIHVALILKIDSESMLSPALPFIMVALGREAFHAKSSRPF